MPTRSESFFNRARKVIPGGVNSPVRFYEPFPFFAASGRGSKLTTVDHKTYVDYCMAYGTLVLGHGYPSVIEAVRNQLDSGTLFCVPTDKEVKLCETMSKVIPCAEMVRLVNTGSEATMNAIRLARAFTKRKKVIKFEGCYHGAHDYVLVKAGSGAAGVPASEGSLEEATSQTLVVPYNDPSSLERMIEKEGSDVACVIIEPVFANMGLVIPDKGYLNAVRKITSQHDVVLIFDEVVTGFRLGLGGASEFFGIKPDLATFAKAMANGFPIGAIAGRKDIMQKLAPAGKMYQASTFAGNPVSVAASIATIDTLIESKNAIYPKIARSCDSLVEGLNEKLRSLNLDYAINTIGSMYQIFFTSAKVRDGESALKSNAVMFMKLYDELIKRDIFIPPSQFETCFLSYVHSEDDVDKTVDAYGEAFRAIKAGQ